MKNKVTVVNALESGHISNQFAIATTPPVRNISFDPKLHYDFMTVKPLFSTHPELKAVNLFGHDQFILSNPAPKGYGKVIFNTACGVVYQSGDTAAALSFINQMSLQQMESFRGPTFCVKNSGTDQIIYRSGHPRGRYYSPTVNRSWQQALDMAMHHKFYISPTNINMSNHPSNFRANPYLLPKGTLHAIGKVGPQGTFLGGGTQIYTASALETSTSHFTIRNPLHFGREVPFYQKINYSGLGHLTSKILTLYDVYKGYENEFTHHSESSFIGQTFAVTSNIGISGATASVLGGGAFFPVIFAGLTVETLASTAQAIKHLPSNVLNENKDFFRLSISDPEMSFEIEQYYLNAFDNNEEWTRNYNQASFETIRGSLKPFEWYGNTKDFIVDNARIIGNTIHNGISYYGDMINKMSDESDDFFNVPSMPVNAPIVNTTTQNSNLVSYPSNVCIQRPNDDDVLTEKNKKVRKPQIPTEHDIHDELPTFPSLDSENQLLSLNLTASNEDKPSALNLVPHDAIDSLKPLSAPTYEFEIVNGNLVPVAGSFALTPEQIQSHLIPGTNNRLNASTESNGNKENSDAVVHYRSRKTKADVEKDKNQKMITKIEYGVVGAGLGMVCFFSKGASVSFSAQATGLLVNLSVPTGNGFWAALSQAGGVTMVAAAAVLVIHYFYSRHLKHVRKKLEKGIKHSKETHKILSDLFDKFEQKHKWNKKVNYDDLIKDIENLMLQVQKSIDDEHQRYKYAKKKGQKKIKNMHAELEAQGHQTLRELALSKIEVGEQKVCSQFIDAHGHKTIDEVVQLATDTFKDVISGIKLIEFRGFQEIIANKMNLLLMQGNFEAANQFLTQLKSMTFTGSFQMDKISIHRMGVASPSDGLTACIKKINGNIDAVNRMIREKNLDLLKLIKLTQGYLDAPVVSNKNARFTNQLSVRKKIALLKSQPISAHSKPKDITDAEWKLLVPLLESAQKQLMFILNNHENLDVIKGIENIPEFEEAIKFLKENHHLSALQLLQKIEQTQLVKNPFLSMVLSQKIHSTITDLLYAGKTSEAIELLKAHALKVVDYQMFNADYIVVIESLKAHLKPKNTAFWKSKLTELNKIAKKDLTAAQSIEQQLSESIIMNDILNHTQMGEYAKALEELEVFVGLTNTQVNFVKYLITHIKAHQKDAGDVKYCLAVLHKAVANTAKTAEGELELQALKSLLMPTINKDLMKKIASDDFEAAKLACDEIIKISPEKKEAMEAMKRDLVVLESMFKDVNTANLLKQYQNPENSAFINEQIERKLLGGVHSNVYSKNFTEAKKILKGLSEKNPALAKLSADLLKVIEFGESHGNDSEDFWLTQYESVLNKTKTNPTEDIDELQIRALEESLSHSQLLGSVTQKSRYGYNLKAMSLVRKMMDKHEDKKHPQYLALVTHEEDLQFAYHGQVVDLFSKPIQNALHRLNHTLEMSWTKTILTGSLEVVQMAQTLVPNVIPLAVQGIHARCVLGNQCVFNRNSANILTQLMNDFKTPLSWQGAALYAQLALKGIQYVPIGFLPDEWFSTVYHARNTVVGWGNYIMQGAFNLNTVRQLGTPLVMEGALLPIAWPMLISTLTHIGIDVGFSTYHESKRKRGEVSESTTAYRTQKAIGSTLDVVVYSGLAGLVTGGLGWIFGGVALLSTAFGLWDNISEQGCTDVYEKVLMAACSNSVFYRELFDKYQKFLEASLVKLDTKLSVDNVKRYLEEHSLNPLDTHFLWKEEPSSNFYVLASVTIEDNKISETLNTTLLDENVSRFVDSMNLITGLLHNDVVNKNLKTFLSLYHFKEPLFSEYLKSVTLKVQNGSLAPNQGSDIVSGRCIIFTRHVSNELTNYNMHFKDKFGEKAILPLSNLSQLIDGILGQDLKASKSVVVDKSAVDFHHFLQIACMSVIKYNLTESVNKIRETLIDKFGGLTYNVSQAQIPNAGRASLFQQMILDHTALNQPDEVQNLTQIITKDNVAFVSERFKFPPHIVWNVLLSNRLRAYIEDPLKIVKFRDEYEIIANAINNSVDSSDDWYRLYFNDVKSALNEVVKTALQNAIIFACQTNDLNHRKQCLSIIRQQYKFCSDWNTLVNNDELKLYAALMSIDLEDKEGAKVFYNSILDLESVLVSKKDKNMQDGILALMDKVDPHHTAYPSAEYKDVSEDNVKSESLPSKQGNYLSYAQSLYISRQFTKLYYYFKGKNNSTEKNFTMAHIYLELSMGVNFKKALSILEKQTVKNTEYWFLTYTILNKFISLVNVNINKQPHDNLLTKLSILIKLVCEKVESCTGSLALDKQKLMTNEIRKYTNFLEIKFSKNKNELESLQAYGHACLRGEKDLNLVKEIHAMLTDYAVSQNHKISAARSATDAGDFTFINYHLRDPDCYFELFGTDRTSFVAALQENEKISKSVNIPNDHVSKLISSQLTLVTSAMDITKVEDISNLNHWFRLYTRRINTLDIFTKNISKKGFWTYADGFTLPMLQIFSLMHRKNVCIYKVNNQGEIELYRYLKTDTIPDATEDLNLLEKSIVHVVINTDGKLSMLIPVNSPAVVLVNEIVTDPMISQPKPVIINSHKENRDNHGPQLRRKVRPLL